MNDLIDIKAVQSRMLLIRDQPVLLDRDVADLYGVETKAVNQAVKRNADRFSPGYILELTAEECSRSQIVTLNGKRGSNLKYLPHAFTERGLYMLATVLKSPRAIAATHAIIETYAQVKNQLLHRQAQAHRPPRQARRRKERRKMNSALFHFSLFLFTFLSFSFSTACRFARALEMDFLPGLAPSRKSSTTKDVPA